jgi:hypothetical protein
MARIKAASSIADMEQLLLQYYAQFRWVLQLYCCTVTLGKPTVVDYTLTTI